MHTPQSCFCLCTVSATVLRVAAVHLLPLGRSWLGHAYKLDALRTGYYPVWRWAAIRSGSQWTVYHRDCPEGEAVTRLWPTASVQSRGPNTAPSHFPKEARNQDFFSCWQQMQNFKKCNVGQIQYVCRLNLASLQTVNQKTRIGFSTKVLPSMQAAGILDTRRGGGCEEGSGSPWFLQHYHKKVKLFFPASNHLVQGLVVWYFIFFLD